jgi:hypothetical protein
MSKDLIDDIQLKKSIHKLNKTTFRLLINKSSIRGKENGQDT